ncbi:helix-turn-helix domain-containing protein [Comamonas sp. Y33R10-2]|uniref:helix-turn-helix domain-containing protein n=1 Tax=Comamonas sp. Y33R10-2 TaxID=2853257 RepID=UPI001C5C87B4|nr:helix-turn-helix domain-containing protein [Comamonas sp. Y33R10-2]QXZ08337.1 helix-turn-helix domain-containing protein [Comamonas sp. Y33R10-2]
MSDSVVEEISMQSEEQLQTQTAATAGTLLRQAREAARVQLSAMAATLKVPVHKLQALEADDYESFPDHVFMRALAMGVCRTLQVDAEPVLALLPQRTLKSLVNSGSGINEAVKVRSNFKSSGSSLDSGNGSSRKIVAGVLILLAAAAAIYFAPFQQPVSDAQGDDTAQSAATVQTELVSHSGAENSAAVALGQASGSLSSSEADALVTEPPVEPAAGVAASTVNTATTALATTAPAAEVAPAPAPVQTPAASSGALLALKVNTGQSWVRVKDATGKVVLEKTLAKDESATAEGQLPLSVTVGNAKGTQVTVRGEPLDISTTRDNVARFEVK